MGWVSTWALAWAPAWAMSGPGPKTGPRCIEDRVLMLVNFLGK